MKSPLNQEHHADAWLRNYADAENLSPGSWMNTFDEVSPWLNITEDDAFFYINVFATGFLKEEFKVSIEYNIITISAYKQLAIAKHGSSFKRSFHLPGNIQQQLISAVYKNEMLMLNLPKLVPGVKKDVPVE